MMTKEQYEELMQVVREIRGSQLRVETMVQQVQEQVAPVMEGLAKSPLGGMLGL